MVNECQLPVNQNLFSTKDVRTEKEAIQEATRCLGLHNCRSCELCRIFCPDLCITYNDAGQLSIDYQYCKGCGICAAVCPKGAIKMVLDKQENI